MKSPKKTITFLKIESLTQVVLTSCVCLVLSRASAVARDAKDEIDFVTRASSGNLAATSESRLALSRASSPEVKAFAARLVEAQEAAEAALQVAAQGSGAVALNRLDPDHQASMTALDGKHGKSFDDAYVADQVEVHSNALTLYADYMLLGDNRKLKALAIRMIPITQAQFRGALTLCGH
nr:DUF4142 domain-containing protein [uncultured Lichenicoccus sp.]